MGIYSISKFDFRMRIDVKDEVWNKISTIYAR